MVAGAKIHRPPSNARLEHSPRQPGADPIYTCNGIDPDEGHSSAFLPQQRIAHRTVLGGGLSLLASLRENDVGVSRQYCAGERRVLRWDHANDLSKVA